jgi:hypothetical protein
MILMENLGKSFLMVIDPNDFDLNKQKVFFDDFSFVFTSESEFFRDSLYKLCQECYKIRRKGFGPKLITDIRKTMKAILRKNLKDERVLLELVALFFDIAYYTVVSHDRVSHFRKFSTVDGVTIKFCSYFGSRDYNPIELIKKVQQKTQKNKSNTRNGFLFEIVQILN